MCALCRTSSIQKTFMCFYHISFPNPSLVIAYWGMVTVTIYRKSKNVLMLWHLCTWPAETTVLVEALQACGSILAGVRSTFGNILFTVVTYKARPITVTLIARREHIEAKLRDDKYQESLFGTEYYQGMAQKEILYFKINIASPWVCSDDLKTLSLAIRAKTSSVRWQAGNLKHVS